MSWHLCDYSQWESWQKAQEEWASTSTSAKNPDPTTTRSSGAKRKLAYIEARGYASIEQRIAEAEETLEAKRAALNDPAIASDGPRLIDASADLEEAQRVVDMLYARWAELEEKQR